eukprot:1813253-Lingulodinium_polyedra.AAC.1
MFWRSILCTKPQGATLRSWPATSPVLGLGPVLSRWFFQRGLRPWVPWQRVPRLAEQTLEQ